MICTAHRTNGDPCKGQAITGAKVCRVHGGSAPQVLAAARRRIIAGVDPVAAKMIKMALAKHAKLADVVTAFRALADKADKYEPPPRGEIFMPDSTEGSNSGTFQEFLATCEFLRKKESEVSPE